MIIVYVKPVPRLCNSGTSQSPIDFNSQPVKITQERNFELRYNNAKGMLKWNSRKKAFVINIPDEESNNLKVQFTPINLKTNKLTTEPKIYKLRKIILRFPAEHVLNGKRPMVEIQFIHHILQSKIKYPYNRLAFSVFADPAEEPDSILSNILPDSEVEFSELISALNTLPYLHYLGSLTYKPCTQDVNWIVFTKRFKIGSAIYSAMKDVIKQKTGKETNNRSTKLIAERKIYQFGDFKLNAKR